MIVTKTPLRISFFGGGTDLPEFSQNNISMIISTTIDTSMYIVVNRSPQNRIKACYDEIEIVDSAKQLKHNRIRECLRYFGIDRNIEVSSFCDIPTKGTGLGSSSTYTVGLVNALQELAKIRKYNKYEIAEIAYEIERNKCDESLGRQDQYAASFGGFNMYIFSDMGTQVTSLDVSTTTLDNLNKNLMFFYTGGDRVANDILKEQAANYNEEEFILTLREMSNQSITAVNHLRRNEIDEFGELLGYGWNLKKKLSSNISNPLIDEYYETAINSGALGGKLLGAGNTGFLMLYVPLKDQEKVRSSLPLKEYYFNFSNNGSEVVYAA